MSKSSIPEKTKLLLWGKAAGRCEYVGCNEPLWQDNLTQAEFNSSYIAHIVADSPKGPRGDKDLSEKLKVDISNLMLICDKHHRLIDKGDEMGHTVSRLLEMKRKHEERIELLTGIQSEKQSEILLYGANIGNHTSPLTYKTSSNTLVPDFFPASSRAIELGLKHSSIIDKTPLYWQLEEEHLVTQFTKYVSPRLSQGDIKHTSLFGLAPMPLLVKLGTLLSDIYPAEIYQLHREPQTWKWQQHPDGFTYTIAKPSTTERLVALNISLSASITNERINAVLGSNTSIWTITIDKPYNDFMQSRQQLLEFRKVMRQLLNDIKGTHGQNTELHIFPAMPVSASVEMGRIWMPKADMPMVIYDQNSAKGGFEKAITIKHQ